MVLLMNRNNMDVDDTMPQTVPSAGFTPPCDYSNFADNFDLSLLPGGDLPLSPSTLLYTQSPPHVTSKQENPKLYTTFYPNSPPSENTDLDLGPDFQKLLVPQKKQGVFPSSPLSGIYLEVPTNKNYHANSPAGALSPYSPQTQGLLSPNEQFHRYPSSPDTSLYNSSFCRSPSEDYHPYIKRENKSPAYPTFKIKEENYASSCSLLSSPTYSDSTNSDTTPDVLELLDSTLTKTIKQESTVDFSSILHLAEDLKSNEPQIVPEKPKDHQLLRQVLRDTSFQKKFNIKSFDFEFIESEIKMEEPDDEAQSELMAQERIARENIEPVLNLAIEQMRKDVDSTCVTLGISRDPAQWTSANVWSWIQWTSRQFGLPTPTPDQWDLSGSSLVTLSEEEFVRRTPQGGMMLHAQLEIWKASCSEERMQWLPSESTASSNASSGDMSDDDEEEPPSRPEPAKPSTSRASSSSHIHLWQFLKELLSSPQVHGSCIRWLDRSKGIFKIEDSVKVARLWGKRKNRPAMNYDKLSRSIRQYYKKGIMKKTERSQRLVYQFCHPYNL